MFVNEILVTTSVYILHIYIPTCRGVARGGGRCLSLGGLHGVDYFARQRRARNFLEPRPFYVARAAPISEPLTAGTGTTQLMQSGKCKHSTQLGVA